MRDIALLLVFSLLVPGCTTKGTANAELGAATVALARGEADVAVHHATEAIQSGELRGSDLSLAFTIRSHAWTKKQEYDKAIQDCDTAISLAPHDARALNSRGLAWSFKNEHEKAIHDFDEAIHLDPRGAYIFDNRASAWIVMKKYDKAVQDCDEAIRLDPHDAGAFNSRGLAWQRMKEYDKAIRDYDEAIRLSLNYAQAFDNRGLTWMAMKKYDKAIQDFEDAIYYDPEDPDAHFNRSLSQMLIRRPRANAGFRTVLELEGWKGELSAHAVILGHLSARQLGDTTAAEQFLVDAMGKLDVAWPYPVVEYLRGEIDEKALLALASDNGEQTDARSFLGLDYALKAQGEKALLNLRWVKEHGDPERQAYVLAAAELERMEQQKHEPR